MHEELDLDMHDEVNPDTLDRALRILRKTIDEAQIHMKKGHWRKALAELEMLDVEAEYLIDIRDILQCPQHF